MTGEGFEYGIRRDVRNNPIVRELDRERHRELWRSAGVAVFLVAVLVFSVWREIELIWHDVTIESLGSEVVAATRTNVYLRGERDALAAPGRIEGIARRELHMVDPATDDHEVIELVTETPPPAGMVVAKR
jgi:hypothetical protein